MTDAYCATPLANVTLTDKLNGPVRPPSKARSGQELTPGRPFPTRSQPQRRFSDLLNYGADDITSAIDPITWRSPEGDSCLYCAAMRGDEDSIRMLVEIGADLSIRNEFGKVPGE